MRILKKSRGVVLWVGEHTTCCGHALQLHEAAALHSGPARSPSFYLFIRMSSHLYPVAHPSLCNKLVNGFPEFPEQFWQVVDSVKRVRGTSDCSRVGQQLGVTRGPRTGEQGLSGQWSWTEPLTVGSAVTPVGVRIELNSRTPAGVVTL